jgi:zinc transporter ZupT
MVNTSILFFLLACCISSVVLSDEHIHGDHSWEWAGIFSLDQDEEYQWSAEKVDGAYAEATMKFVMMAVTSSDAEGIEEVEDSVNMLFNSSAIAVTTADQIVPDSLLELQFDDASWISLFKLSVPTTGIYGIFTEHDPTEFESSSHYFKLLAGEEVEAEYEDMHEESVIEDDQDDDWGNIIGACLVVWATNLIGLFVVTKYALGFDKETSYLMQVCGKLFGAGALLSTAYSLILLEASHLISERQHISESEVNGQWSAMLLLGFVSPALVDFFTHSFFLGLSKPSTDTGSNNIVGISSETKQVEDQIEKSGEVELGVVNAAETVLEGQSSKSSSFEYHRETVRLISGILLGDFFHNYSDGIFIGAAMMSCSVSFGWTVAAATVYHELTQELGDYLILTEGLKWSSFSAILWNVITGASVVLGGITIVAANISNYSIGMLLAFGAGNYIYVGSVEMMSCLKEHEDEKSKAMAGVHYRRWVIQLCGLASFIIAATAIGLVLLDHDHCDSSSSEGGAGGHDHGR